METRKVADLKPHPANALIYGIANAVTTPTVRSADKRVNIW